MVGEACVEIQMRNGRMSSSIMLCILNNPNLYINLSLEYVVSASKCAAVVHCMASQPLPRKLG